MTGEDIQVGVIGDHGQVRVITVAGLGSSAGHAPVHETEHDRQTRQTEKTSGS